MASSAVAHVVQEQKGLKKSWFRSTPNKYTQGLTSYSARVMSWEYFQVRCTVRLWYKYFFHSTGKHELSDVMLGKRHF